MAILDDVPGIKVTVQVNDQDAVEYDDPAASELDSICPTSSKYIECLDDAQFTIRSHVTSEYKWGYKDHCLNFRARADGASLMGVVCKEEDMIYGTHTLFTKGALEVDSQTKKMLFRRCQFSAISTGTALCILLHTLVAYPPTS